MMRRYYAHTRNNGLPTGKVRNARTLEATGIENILKAIRMSELDSDDALQIVEALKGLELIDIPAVKSGNGAVLLTK
jgi:hypothetical protein